MGVLKTLMKINNFYGEILIDKVLIKDNNCFFTKTEFHYNESIDYIIHEIYHYCFFHYTVERNTLIDIAMDLVVHQYSNPINNLTLDYFYNRYKLKLNPFESYNYYYNELKKLTLDQKKDLEEKYEELHSEWQDVIDNNIIIEELKEKKLLDKFEKSINLSNNFFSLNVLKKIIKNKLYISNIKVNKMTNQYGTVKRKRKFKLLFYIDNSKSITDNTLSLFYTFLNKIKKWHYVYICNFDTKLDVIQKFRNINLNRIKNGGTDYSILKKLNYDYTFVLTDGEGEYIDNDFYWLITDVEHIKKFKKSYLFETL